VFLRPLYRRPVTDKVTAESIIFITWAFYITIFGKKDIETDKVKQKLASLIQRHTDLKALFVSDRSHINLVLNDDRLSVSEASRIQCKLSSLDIDISRIIVNKVKNSALGEGVQTTFAGVPISLFPVHPNGLYGLHTLEDYLCKHLPEIDFESGAHLTRTR